MLLTKPHQKYVKKVAKECGDPSGPDLSPVPAHDVPLSQFKNLLNQLAVQVVKEAV